MSIIGTVYEDVTTDVLGDIGCWQWLVTFVSTILMTPSLFNQHEDMLLLQPPDVICLPPPHVEVVNSTLCTFTSSNSTEEITCKKWHIKLMWLIWLKKSWLVFCDDKSKLFSTTLICRLGLVFGCIIYGLISDSFGRRNAIILDVFAELVFRLIVTFCDAEGWYRLIVFLRALFGSANVYMGLVLSLPRAVKAVTWGTTIGFFSYHPEYFVCEIASNRWRSWLSVIVMSPRLAAMVCLVPLANSAPNTETFSFIACLSGVLLVVILRWTPESPQWLLYNRKIHVAEKILAEAGKRNGFKFSSEFKIRPVNYRAYNCLEETTTCVGVLTTCNIRVLVLVSLLFWSLYFFQWSSIILRVYSGDHINNVLLKIIGFFTALGCLTTFLAERLKLRLLLMINIILTGVFNAGAMFVQQESVQSLLSSLALATGLIVHALILNITPRLFAINIRATLFGCCHATGQLGATVSYLVFRFEAASSINNIAVQIGVTIMLAAMCFVFPDVDGRELPDVMEDMDYFSELSKPLRWATQKTSSPSYEEVEMRVYSFGSAGTTLTTSTRHSQERLPAQPVGFLRLWRLVFNCVL